ncbi:snakin-2-like [Tasmannia lanceolata]|uniref:snakin-2-like n=1 Tax=Tasmannia lanceolata TaxID=3420 RepID=UPI0040631464
MALRVLFLAVVLVILLSEVQTKMEGSQVVAGSGNRKLVDAIDCDALCKVRCSLHSRPNVCTRACGTCCFRCKCVPPGTSGNREVCGSCYTDMLTHGNRTKCP